MTTEAKFIAGIGVVTLGLIIGGVFFIGRSESNKPTGPVTIDQSSVTAGAMHTIGDASAPVSIVEFADFQCPACGAAHPINKAILEKYKDKAYFVYRHFPLPIHSNAKPAARAAEAAGKQNKFWEMHDKLFENQNDWSNDSSPEDKFESYAKDLGLDVEKYKQDVKDIGNVVEDDYSLGMRSGVDSTPTFFINGEKQPGVITMEKFDQFFAGK